MSTSKEILQAKTQKQLVSANAFESPAMANLCMAQALRVIESLTAELDQMSRANEFNRISASAAVDRMIALQAENASLLEALIDVREGAGWQYIFYQTQDRINALMAKATGAA